jgi:hypothetical protein
MLRIETIECPMFGKAGLVRVRLNAGGNASVPIEHVLEGLQKLDDIEAAMERLNVSAEELIAAREMLPTVIHLAPDATTVALALKNIELPEDFDPRGAGFVLDTDEPVSVPRGNLYAGDDRVAVGSLASGWFTLAKLVEDREITPDQGIYLFQQLITADLTLEQEDFKKRLAAAEQRLGTDQAIERNGPPHLELTDHPVLSLLGFRQAVIHFDGKTFFSVTRDNIERQLAEVDHEAFAPLITELAEVTDMPANVVELMTAIREFDVPADLPNPIQFEQCMTEDCYPLPHGHMLHLDEQQPGGLSNVMDGVNHTFGAIEDGPLSPEQVIAFLQQMMAIDMPLDETDEKQRYAEVPVEARETWEAQQASTDGLDGLLSMLQRALG